MTPSLERARGQRRRRGFTLLELAITISILGLLSAGLVYAVGAVTATISAREAETLMDRVATAEMNFASVYGSYTAQPTDLTGLGRELIVVSGRATGFGQVSVALGDDGTLGIAAVDDRDRCIARYLTSLEAGAEQATVTVPETSVCDGAVALPDGEAVEDPESKLDI